MRFAFFRRSLGALAMVALIVASTASAADRKFSTSPVLATEARTLIQLLEQAHYNRDAVRDSDYVQVVPDYMSELDGQHLFFLGSDKTQFEQRYSKSLYWNVRDLGNIDAAYEIFAVYEQRVNDRVNWIFRELDKDFDLSAHDTYRVDRSKAEWPANATAADQLWQSRLKFEILAELLNKKPIAEAKQTVRKRYERMLKNVAELEGSDLAEIYLSTIARLYDPQSTYWSADTYEDFGIQMKLQLVGIGALLGIEEDNCVVKEIVPGGPADIGKQLRPNDKIISVAQKNTEPVEVIGMKLRKVVDMIRGQKGTPVTLLVQPADATDPSARKEITIVRDVVKLNSARAHAAIFQVPGENGKTLPLGVISLPAFYGPADDDSPDAEKSSASKDVARLITQLQEAGIDGLVLDLRRNGGGFLTEAIAVAGLFIPHGPVVQVKNQVGEIQVDNDESDSVAYDGPLVVLTDRFSASASEIVTGALQNYGRAVVVGDSSTHGKGTVQTVLEMKNLVPRLQRAGVKTGATKITVQKYYLPNGSSTQLKGVVPDIVLPSIEDYLPIGEKDLPRALAWDEVPTAFFDGKPLDAKVLSPLREASEKRQESLEEFAYLRRYVDWFKTRQEQKLVSLNLDTREAQKKSDDDFQQQMKAEREQLAKNDFTFKEFRLGPPPPPKVKPPKKEGSDSEDDETELSTDDNETYGKVDIHLRESLRVLKDALVLVQNRQLWVEDHAPLTAQTSTR